MKSESNRDHQVLGVTIANVLLPVFDIPLAVQNIFLGTALGALRNRPSFGVIRIEFEEFRAAIACKFQKLGGLVSY